MRERSFGYLPRDGVLHRADALSKLLWLLLAAVLPFVLSEWWQLAAHVLVLVTLCALISPSDPGLLARPLGLSCFLAALLVFFHILTRHEGTELVRVGWLAVHDDGVGFGVVYGLRVLSVMVASYVFVRTTSPRALVVALVTLGIPYRYAWMLFVAMLSIPVFEAEYAVVREAQLIRGVRPGSWARQRLDLLNRSTRSLLVVGLRRVEHLSVAMDARAFGAHPRRTFTDPFTWSAGGLTMVLVWALAIAAATWARLG